MLPDATPSPRAVIAACGDAVAGTLHAATMAARARDDRPPPVGRPRGTFVASDGVVTCIARIEPIGHGAWVGLLVLGRATFAIRGRYLASQRAGYGFVLAAVDRRRLARLVVRATRAGLTLQVDLWPTSARRPGSGPPVRIRLERWGG